MASELRVNTLKDASGSNSIGLSYVANGSAKVWCTWNMNSTNVVSDSFNVTNLTDDGTGINRVNFTNSMNNAVYAVTSCFYESTNTNTNVLKVDPNTAPATSSVMMEGGEFQASGSNVNRDLELAYTVIHGDLA
tara:strand:+ start:379 stop:780 length:402 start_codon:yes stop_codon:yes gene_type:complete